MTGTSNVELLHEIEDRTRVLKRFKYEETKDTDMNALLVSDASPDSCRSMYRLLGNVSVESKHVSSHNIT
jgi:hypothetical protein